MLCELTSQNISLRDKQTQYYIIGIGNSTAIAPEIDEKIDTLFYIINLLKQRQKSKPARAHLLPILEIDFSSVSPSFETRSETSLIRRTDKEVIHEEMIEHDIFVQMSPKERHTIKVRGFIRKKAEPRIVLPEWL